MPLPVHTGGARRLLRDEVFQAIYDAIIDGVLEPGEVLRDEDLMEWLTVSRTPIRQALNRLSDIGLVEMTPGRFTKVSDLNPELARDSLFTTGVFHAQAARKSVPNLSDEELVSLNDCLARAEEAANEQHSADFGHALTDYFRLLQHSSGHEITIETTEYLSPAILRFFSSPDSPFALRDLEEKLRELNAAVQRKDADEAASQIRGLHLALTQMLPE